jgi:predicted PurR-regulated permease PerM
VKTGPNDLTRVTFAVLTLALLIGASLWVLRPFLGPTIWATMVVVATWPVMLRVQGWLGGRRSLAVAVMTLLLLLLFVVPLVVAIVTIVQNTDQIVSWAKWVTSYRVTPTPPEPGWPRCPWWARGWPRCGNRRWPTGWTGCCSG